MAGFSSTDTRRVLAIDPTSKGFGYAVLEGPETLVDWGVKHANGPGSRNRECVDRVADLIARYQPDVLVVEHTSSKGCQRRARVRRLIKSLLVLARRQGIRTRQISRRSMLRSFFEARRGNKHQIALALIERFPELEPFLPYERTRWHGLSACEDERTAIFDALAFAWTFYRPLHKERRALAALSTEPALPNA